MKKSNRLEEIANAWCARLSGKERASEELCPLEPPEYAAFIARVAERAKIMMRQPKRSRDGYPGF